MATAHQLARGRLEQAVTLHRLATDALQYDWEGFKALAAATIVMGRSVLHFIQRHDGRKPGFKAWWTSLEGRYPTLKFFRDERDALLKERFFAVHGQGYADTGTRFVLKAEGEELPPSPPPTPVHFVAEVRRQAFLDESGWDDKPALDYIADYLMDLESVIVEAETSF